MTIYLLKYNNYYNRTIKKYYTIDELLDRDDVVEIGTFENVNFNPGDGVATQLTLNYTPLIDQPNYLVVADSSYPGIISLSSWFILDAQYVRLGQYVLSLRRDLVNDLWDTLADSPFFIEKATLPANSPFIFNKENMTYNQIKTDEQILTDKTNIPWIVGYMNREYAKDNDEPIIIGDSDVSIVAEYATDEEYAYNKYVDKNFYAPSLTESPTFRLNFFRIVNIDTQKFCYVWNNDKQEVVGYNEGTATGPYLYNLGAGTRGFPCNRMAYTNSEWVQPLKTALNLVNWKTLAIHSAGNNLNATTDLEGLINENGKIYKLGDKIVKIHVERQYNLDTVQNVAVGYNSAVGIEMQKVSNSLGSAGVLNTNVSSTDNVFELRIPVVCYKLTYEELVNNELQITIPQVRTHTIDAPYDIFCIPYGNIGWQEGTPDEDNPNGISLYRTDASYGMRLAQEIINKLGVGEGGNLYDIQLLPYCPINEKLMFEITNNGIVGGYKVKPGVGDSPLRRVEPGLINSVFSAIFWVSSSQFSFSFNAPKAITVPNDPIEVKVANECDLYRLSSPNYNGTFEFSAVKNGGVNAFDVDCAYKPYQPYIRISPAFGGLYGKDFNDARGLILGGDFSLPQMSDAWTTYQNQNKNYQVMFDRQIKNMDRNNDVQRKMELGNIITGSLQGATTGMMMGSMTPLGSAAMAGGAILGGAVSAIGGAFDRKYNEELRQEARDYTMDQFGYQLGNIMARPDNITKISAFNPNNKIFPVLEYYTATNEEKDALRNKLRYNGMTVMVIGTITDFLQTEPSYIKGKLIRLNDDMEDYHIVNALADELYQGVFV